MIGQAGGGVEAPAGGVAGQRAAEEALAGAVFVAQVRAVAGLGVGDGVVTADRTGFLVPGWKIMVAGNV